MITGEITIDTTWAASTSFVPFHPTLRNAYDEAYGGTNNRAYFATTAYISGIWEEQIYEDAMKNRLGDNASGVSGNRERGSIVMMSGMGGMLMQQGNSFQPGTIIECEVRKIKALKASPNRSGVQVNRRLVKGNRLIFRYVAAGELNRPR